MGGGVAGHRRLRKTRSLQSQTTHAAGEPSADLPVFLVNPNRLAPLPEEEEPSKFDLRSRLSELSEGATAKLSPFYHAAQIKSKLLSQRLHSLPSAWQQGHVRENAVRAALIALVFPLALLAVFERAPSPVKTSPVHAQAPKPAPPAFDLDKRLAFAQNLREQLLANAIALSLKPKTLPETMNGSASSDTQAQSVVPRDLDSGTAPAPQIATDDRTWSLPFGGQNYIPSDLPRTSEGSFRATTALSDLMTDKVERPTVAEYDERTVVPAPKAKQEKIGKRKKAVAQKRKPAQQVNQMTAAAQPTLAQPEPNLPPPPILFFLGAPPPTAQPAQPVQVAPVQSPPASAAPATAPQSPPPANNSWVPNSISDAFKNAY